MLKMKPLKIVGLAALVLLTRPALSDTLFSNGPIGGDTGRCASGPSTCGGGDFTIYDNFSLSQDATISGFKTWTNTAAAPQYLDVFYKGLNWSIWDSEPTPNGTPIAAGTTMPKISEDGTFLGISVDGLSTTLASGNYWVGFSHQVVGSTGWTYISADNGQHTALMFNGKNLFYANIYDAAFQIEGAFSTPLPEAGTGIYMFWGAFLIFSRRWKTA